MKKTALFFALSVIAICCFGQAKKEQPKKIYIEVDSADAVNFLTIFQVGLANLMNTSIPANQVTGIQNYGNALFQKNVAIYQSWLPKTEAPKKDSVIKKP